MTIKSSQGSNPKIRYNFKIPDLIFVAISKILAYLCFICSSGRDCIHMHKRFQPYDMSAQQRWIQPIVFLGRICCSKERQISAIQTFKTESFNRSFYLSIILMFEVNCFLPTHVILLRIVEGGCESDVYVHNSLNEMFAKCGSMVEAGRVFHSMAIQNMMCLHRVPEFWDVTRNG
jgi:hypothetical protein